MLPSVPSPQPPQGRPAMLQALASPALPCLQLLASQIIPHLGDLDLKVPKLLRLLGMSQSGLHRKLKMATGMSATAYIRYLRLRRAARLLTEQPEQSVFCIAIEVGFNDHSYFTRRFREAYGVSPANFRTEQRNLEHT